MAGGSSPHARGALLRLLNPRVAGGIIPACAGSTRRRRCRAPWPWDHPRMRGEHDRGTLMTSGGSGSSPHARGARVPRRRGIRARGIIPACAGSTAANWSRTRCGRDHPRMRGEHRIAADTPQLFVGSSPHARGAPDLAHRPHARLGIIPACAGSTSGTTRCPSARRDHPRMRGEHGLARLVGRHVPGIIPACAGSTGWHARCR